MSNTATFTAWNIDPAFSFGALDLIPPGWTWVSDSNSTTLTDPSGTGIDLAPYLITVTLIDFDEDGFVRPDPQDRVIINGVESGVSAVWVGDSMVIDGVEYQVVTFYTTDNNAFSLPIATGSGNIVAAFAGFLTGTEYIFTSTEVALPFETLENLPELCLMRGTLVRSAQGETPVEDLRPGDLVQTIRNGLQPVRWVGVSYPRKPPIRIAPGALGNGLPRRALFVSHQHRIYVGTGGTALGLVPAKALVGQQGIQVAPGRLKNKKFSAPEMYHLLFDRHEIILAEGLAVESLLLAPGSLEAMTNAQRISAWAAVGQVPPRPHRQGENAWHLWPRRIPEAAPLLRPSALHGLPAGTLQGFGEQAHSVPPALILPSNPVGGLPPDTDVLAIPLNS